MQGAPLPTSHVELRPMFDFGDHTVISSFDDAEYFGVYSALIGEPVSRNDVFDSCSDATAYMFEYAERHGCSSWYNGNETLSQVRCSEDIFKLLAEYVDTEADMLALGEEVGIKSPSGKG